MDHKKQKRQIVRETRAKERVIIIYFYVKEKEEVEGGEEFNEREPLCPDQDALLRVHDVVASAVETMGDLDKEECDIVPASQSANIIGKSGATVKKLRSKTMCYIKVTAKDAIDPTRSYAMKFDNFLQVCQS
ncbi:hypothetical protein Nepgr_022757 [Nepenthes gracilis]|uniref:K Homology domain-containing protein n=1 Tax=Nepenthes gracilis TaxID=150966 RepID=A0AAD3T022_NEPGR|nr:hypothetical protein Nepgr_022757 [Nepenthes gracilis]